MMGRLSVTSSPNPRRVGKGDVLRPLAGVLGPAPQPYASPRQRAALACSGPLQRPAFASHDGARLDHELDARRSTMLSLCLAASPSSFRWWMRIFRRIIETPAANRGIDAVRGFSNVLVA